MHLNQFEKKVFLSQVTQAMEKKNTTDNIDGEVEERVRSDSTTSGIFPKNVPKMCHYKEMGKRVIGDSTPSGVDEDFAFNGNIVSKRVEIVSMTMLMFNPPSQVAGHGSWDKSQAILTNKDGYILKPIQAIAHSQTLNFDFCAK